MKKLHPNENSENLIGKAMNKMSAKLIILLIVFLSFSLFRNISNVKKVEKKIADKEKEVQAVKKEQEDLQKKLEYTQSQEFIEKQLRDKLGMAKTGEIVLVLPPPEVLRNMAPKYSEEEAVLPDPNWKRWLKLFI